MATERNPTSGTVGRTVRSSATDLTRTGYIRQPEYPRTASEIASNVDIRTRQPSSSATTSDAKNGERSPSLSVGNAATYPPAKQDGSLVDALGSKQQQQYIDRQSTALISWPFSTDGRRFSLCLAAILLTHSSASF